MIYNKTDINNYAESLVFYEIYKSLEEALKESERFFKKAENGLLEPFLCPSKIPSKTKFVYEFIYNEI